MTLQRKALAARAFGWALRLSSWLASLPGLLTPPPFRLLQIGSAFWQSRALYVAAELDIASVLGDERLSVEEIADKVGANPDALNRLMRMLSSLGVFHRETQGVYRNNKLSDRLRTNHRECVRPMILMHNSEAMSRPWYEQLRQGINTGQVPFQLAHGRELYHWMDSHPDFMTLFGQAMESVEALAGDSFATCFDWRRFDRVIDVGGSRGAKAVAILRCHPNLKALVVDLAPAIKGAPEYWASREPPGLSQRLEFQACDLLASAPMAQSHKDIYLLSAVLHGFNDEDCIKILGNISKAAAPQGALVAVMEMALTEGDGAVAAFDMQMFVCTAGRERTLAEWNKLFVSGGMRLQEIVRLASVGQIFVLQPVADP